MIPSQCSPGLPQAGGAALNGHHLAPDNQALLHGRAVTLVLEEHVTLRSSRDVHRDAEVDIEVAAMAGGGSWGVARGRAPCKQSEGTALIIVCIYCGVVPEGNY